MLYNLCKMFSSVYEMEVECKRKILESKRPYKCSEWFGEEIPNDQLKFLVRSEREVSNSSHVLIFLACSKLHLRNWCLK